MDQLCAALAQGRAAGVFGLRKVGKTSLLRAAAEKLDPWSLHLDAPLGFPAPEVASTDKIAVLLDVQSLTHRTLDAVARQLARRLSRRLEQMPAPAVRSVKGALPSRGVSVTIAGPEAAPAPLLTERSQSTARSLDGGVDAVDGLNESSQRPVAPLDELDSLISRVLESTSLTVCFLIDEYDLLFEGYGGEPGVPEVEKLFALLRSRAQATGRIGLALVGRDPTFVERPLLFGITNPLLGWVTVQWLGPLAREPAASLLRQLGRRVGLDMGPATLEAAWQWTGGHPLLLRQFGAAVHELAEAVSPRPWPVRADDLRARSERKFRARSMVETTCGEIRALLSARFPEARQLLVELASAPEAEIEAVLAGRGGDETPAARVLSSFGILLLGPVRWIPRLFREAFGRGAAARDE